MTEAFQQREHERKSAQQTVRWFVRRFQDTTYEELIEYAALPLVFTPELLHYLRSRFVPHVPWVAEADLLLSDLCSQIGYEQFVMDPTVRATLLEQFRRRPDSERQMREVARVLIDYARDLEGNPFLSKRERQAQEWSALAYLSDQRQDVVREIAEAMAHSWGNDAFADSIDRALIDRADLMRLAGIAQTLAPQLKDAPELSELVRYAEDVSRVLAGPSRPAKLSQPLPVRKVMGVLLPDPRALPPTLGDLVRLVRDGLNALAQLVRAPAVHAAVAAMRPVLQAARSQIGSIAGDVELLDLLHRLRLSCYNRIADEARQLRRADWKAENLGGCINDFEEITGLLRQAVERGGAAGNAAGWLGDLAQSLEELRAAIDRVDADQFVAGEQRMRRVLNYQHVRISAHLNGTVRESGLLGLDQILATDVNPKQRRRLRVGRDALAKLSEYLAARVKEYDAWQPIEADLRLIEDDLDHVTDQLVRLWPHVRAAAERLYGKRAGAWAESLRTEEANLEAAIKSRNPVRRRRVFDQYHRLVGGRMEQIVRELKDVCDGLRQIDAALGTILEQL